MHENVFTLEKMYFTLGIALKEYDFPLVNKS